MGIVFLIQAVDVVEGKIDSRCTKGTSFVSNK